MNFSKVITREHSIFYRITSLLIIVFKNVLIPMITE